MPRLLLPFAVASGLALHGLRGRSLSPAGSLAAFFVGFCTLSPRTNIFATCLIVFYLTGSRATKSFIHSLDGKQRKASYEDGYHEAGYRSAFQVFSNSLGALIAALAWMLLYDTPSILFNSSFFSDNLPSSSQYNSTNWCPVISHPSGHPYSKACIYAALGHFSCCLGDTLASELGILSSSPPILVTTLKPVPRGTNGGISLGGTAASLIGGLIVGLCGAVTLVLESSACREQAWPILSQLLFLGGFAGVGGSMVDSLLGATIQRTRYSPRRGKILSDEQQSGADGSEDKITERGWNILSNNQVNMVSSLFVAVASARFA